MLKRLFNSLKRKTFWWFFMNTRHDNKKGLFKKGIQVDIIPTTRCNYKCSYCPMFLHGEVKRYDECTLEEWQTFIKRIRHWVSTFYISGGEPGLYKDIVPLTNWLIERGHKVIIMTNLSYPEKFKGIKPHWRLMFLPTFHLEFAKPQKFQEGIDWLKKQGYNVTSQQILQNDGNFTRIKEFFTPEYFEYEDENFQFAPDSPRSLRIYVGCVNLFRKD